MWYLINLCPIVLNLLLLPFWYLEEVFYRSGITSYCEPILNGMVVPIFLLIFNIRFINRHREKRLGCFLMMCVSVIGSALVHYLNWGITCGRFFTPDDLTIGLVLWIDIIWPLAIIFIGMTIYEVVYAIKSRKRKIN